MSEAIADPQVEHPIPSASDSNSVLTAESNKVDDDMKLEGQDDENAPQAIEIPIKPASAYITISIFCVMIGFGGFIAGWDTGTIGGFLAHPDFLQRFGSKHHDGTPYFSNVRTGLVVSIFNIGGLIGCLTLGGLADRIGRKMALVFVTAVYMVGIIIQIASINKWYQYFIGRIISGMGVGSISIFSPMLLSEVAPKHLRGTLGSMYQLMCTFGIFLGDCTNYGTKSYSNSVQWRVPLGLGFAWSLLMIGAMFFVPESPRYLMEVGKTEDAKRSIATSNKVSIDDPSVTAEAELIQAGIEAERAAGSATWGDMFSTNGKVLQRLLMCCMLQTLQQLTGCNYFFYYGTIVFQAVGLNDSYQTAIVFGIVNFASTFFAFYCVDRFGRRACLMWGAAAMVACYVVYASVGVTRLWPDGTKHKENSSKGAGNCMIVFSCFFIFCFACTWAPICWIVVSETFPLKIKPKGMALANSCNWLWNFLISFFTPFITGAINFYYGYVFMGCMVFAYFYVFFFVPETKGLTLEEVNEMWEEGTLPWKSTAWVPASKRGADYDADALNVDDKPMYKRMFSRK
ncbi:alpha-glucoside permease [Maudiozyma humilis]|uniref:Alpha-glucoside permease n=1 Tax=Maudiozyma humilis TaxID=51915 RepID=A0AAV5RW92_MAUHU|nr:alpha-glucoside permease [Kazachstania humilis]